MSTWNLRIIHYDKREPSGYGVHEVFYNEDGTVFDYTENPIDITGETIEDVKKYAQMIVDDINKSPVLVQSEIVIIHDFDPSEDCISLEELLELEEKDDIY